MPVLFVHGVAVRNEDDPQFSVVERLTRGAEWPVVEELLRTHVAPELNRADPDAVDIARVYWGDLGARPADDPALEADAEQARSGPVVTPEDLGEGVAPEVVGAHGVRPRGWERGVRGSQLTGAEAPQPGSQHGGHHDEAEHHQRSHRQAVLQEAPPGTGGARRCQRRAAHGAPEARRPRRPR